MMDRFAVIGHPIGHTMSPFIHKRLFECSKINAEYSALDIFPDQLASNTKNQLLKLSGFNVTIPHKEAIIPLLYEIDDSAKKYNAVNCVKCKNGKLYGCSTDAFGFTAALTANNVSLSGDVLILGSGGAARTIAREAADHGCTVTIAVRESDIQKANELKDWLCKNGGRANTTLIKDINGKFDLCVNATPVGMYPNVNACPIGEEILKNCSAAFDAVYNPRETEFLKLAKKLQLKAIGGMTMLVWQAVKAHEFWYNAKFEIADVQKIIDEANAEMEHIFYEK